MFELIKKVFTRKDKDSIETIRRYQTVYNTEMGRWVIEDILRLCNYGGSCVGKTDIETYFKLGEHNIGLEIAQRITANLSELEDAKKQEEHTNVQD
ncbi:MAG: hypothetical protein DRH37_09925 [Deltaproteobacteria bacterium]|nr:MAG: hypothetical protein DRH37_09925 [Deltaproteobacteria bacterium]